MAAPKRVGGAPRTTRTPAPTVPASTLPASTLPAWTLSASTLPAPQGQALLRADAELVAAQFSHEPWERYSHAHLAAVRAGAGLVAARGRPVGRRAPRTVWEMLDVVAPELARWSGYFSAGASLRSAIEAGRFDAVSAERAEEALCTAEDFVDAVTALLAAALPERGGTGEGAGRPGLAPGTPRRALALRAS